MSIWSMVGGLFKPARELVEVFTPNAEREAERHHAEQLSLGEQDMAVVQQFAREFEAKTTATKWDSFANGLNRLPRPLITLGVLGLFVLAPLDPLRFIEVARAYQLMPEGFWALLSLIIAFYFGGRMQFTRQQMSLKGGAVAAAKEIVAVRKAVRALEPEGDPERAEDEPPIEHRFRRPAPDAGSPEPLNPVIAAWEKKGRPKGV
jgi:hypothetical protein